MRASQYRDHVLRDFWTTCHQTILAHPLFFGELCANAFER